MSTPEEVLHLPASLLLDMACNTSASMEWRKAAVQLLVDKGYPQANHPDIALLRYQIQREREARAEVEAIVETAIESEIPECPPSETLRPGPTELTTLKGNSDES